MGIPAVVLLLVVFCSAVSLLLTRTKVGRFFYAIGDNHQASRIAGIPGSADAHVAVPDLWIRCDRNQKCLEQEE